jgi:hypothetical protein
MRSLHPFTQPFLGKVYYQRRFYNGSTIHNIHYLKWKIWCHKIYEEIKYVYRKMGEF